MVRLQLALAILVLGTNADAAEGVEIYASADGDARGTGSVASPTTLRGAVLKVRDMLATEERPEGGVTVYLRGGMYPIEQAIALGHEFKGSAESPIVIRNYPGEDVLFDGGKYMDMSGFAEVTEPQEKARLSAAAAPRIMAKTITDPAMIEKLKSEVVLNLGVDGEIYLPSCYPNSGYAEFEYDYAVAEISPPAVPMDKPEGSAGRAGSPPWQEPGKPRGWKGDLAEPRGAQVGIGQREDEMAGTWLQWANEINANNARNILTGFVTADWALESFPLYAANAEEQTVHLSRATGYGWHGAKHEHKHFRVYGLLCELDRPGEWHFDTQTNRFYIYPPETLRPDTRMGFPFAQGFLVLEGCAYVSVIGIDVQNVGSGVVFAVQGGHHNLIAGCTVRNCTARGIIIDGGTHNGASACDLVDLDYHAGLSGGIRSPDEITPAYNFVENCHMYQVKFGHARVGIGLSGVGNMFSNNLVHNSMGQAMMIRGNDHIIERNEMFNIGYDEGDGGAMYAGADLAGYGVSYRHNFFHHLIHVPGKVARAAIHLDDLQAGAILTGNVFYKSAQKGIFMNAGSGHVIRENVFLEGSLGIYNVGVGSSRTYERQLAITADPHHDLRGNKEDYIGRAEDVVGPEGWNNEPWKSRYPRFALVMNDRGPNGRLWPIRCVVENNLYYGNGRGDHAVWSRFSPESEAKSIIANEKVIAPDIFVDYEALDLRFRQQGVGMPHIPFEKIGLYLDDHRNAMPEKKHYRRVIKDFFEDVKSMPGSRKQINTGLVVEESPIVRNRRKVDD